MFKGRGGAAQLQEDRQEPQQEHAGQRGLPLLQTLHEQVVTFDSRNLPKRGQIIFQN